MKTIPSSDFTVRINELWNNRWLLLTSGNYEMNSFNTMAVAWGYFGIMWNKPMAVVVVQPGRFTFEFMEKYKTFTLTAFSEEYKKDLLLMGSLSGRDMDKITGSDLTPVASSVVSAPAYKEAELIVECRKVYWDDFKPENFVDLSIENNYPKKDYHRMYFGEVVHISGIENYADE